MFEKVNVYYNNKSIQSVIKKSGVKKGFSKYRHGGKLRDNIKIKMSVRWISHISNELCDYLSQRKKKKIKLTDIWDHKQITRNSLCSKVDTNKLIPEGFPV